MQAIVLKVEPHTDKSIFVHTYTRAYGRKLYMVFGAGSKTKRLAELAPLSLVELTEQHAQRDVPTIKELHLNYVPTQLPTDPKKQIVALFIAEALTKVLAHPMEDEPLFNFLDALIRELDTTSTPEQIPEYFVQQLSLVMGYGGQRLEEFEHLKSAEMLRMLF